MALCQLAAAALSRPFNILKEQVLPAEADQLLAAVAQHVHQDTGQTFGGVTPVIAQALQMLKQMQVPTPVVVGTVVMPAQQQKYKAEPVLVLVQPTAFQAAA